MKSNIFITGFSGSGKTTVGQEVAGRLGWRFMDIDSEIVKEEGQPIEAIFKTKGEAHFRKLESQHLATVCERENQVVSTGGGIIMDERNLTLMAENGAVVCLEASPETLHRRLKKQREASEDPIVRPMLASSDPLDHIRALKAKRQANYALAHWTVHTDELAPKRVATEVIRGWQLFVSGSGAHTDGKDPDLASTVRTASGDCSIWVGWDILDQLGERLKGAMSPGAAYIITDEGVYTHAHRAQFTMEAAGIPTHMMLMPPGETSKNLDTVQRVYQWLSSLRAERSHPIVAVGGGVVGDLAGFVAATFLRGLPFVQVPTTLLAMVDASIGGKVAVDMPEGKNLIGAFYQPRFVLTDVKTLSTLPQRELTSGWAEVIKHGLALDEGLLRTLEDQVKPILDLEQDITTEVVRRSAAVKADIVSQDERETLGTRTLLNYGHTIGHAIEAATDYRDYLHGEAVSVGMMGAAYISHEMGLMASEEVSRQREVLESFGLPLTYGDIDVDAMHAAMRMDKKTWDKTIRWVLLEQIGKAVVRNDVPDELVIETLRRLTK